MRILISIVALLALSLASESNQAKQHANETGNESDLSQELNKFLAPFSSEDLCLSFAIQAYYQSCSTNLAKAENSTKLALHNNLSIVFPYMVSPIMTFMSSTPRIVDLISTKLNMSFELLANVSEFQSVFIDDINKKLNKRDPFVEKFKVMLTEPDFMLSCVHDRSTSLVTMLMLTFEYPPHYVREAIRRAIEYKDSLLLKIIFSLIPDDNLFNEIVTNHLYYCIEKCAINRAKIMLGIKDTRGVRRFSCSNETKESLSRYIAGHISDHEKANQFESLIGGI